MVSIVIILCFHIFSVNVLMITVIIIISPACSVGSYHGKVQQCHNAILVILHLNETSYTVLLRLAYFFVCTIMYYDTVEGW